MKSFEDYLAEWEKNAKKDAYWSVLTSKEYENVQWDRLKFFQTGIHEIQILKDYIEKVKLSIHFQGSALDFGCGVGRITQALGGYFREVKGVDVSENMVRQAEEALQSRSHSAIKYIHNPHPHLKIFADQTFELIYSNIVLQHISKKHQIAYLHEFARVIKPGGWIIVQIPSRRLYASLVEKFKGAISTLLPYKLKKLVQIYLMNNRTKALKNFDFEINTCPEKIMYKIARENHLEIKHIAYTNSCDSNFCGNIELQTLEEAAKHAGFLSPMYFMTKQV